MSEEEVKTEQKSNKGLLIAIIAVAVLLIAVIVAVVLFLSGEKKPKEEEVQAPAPVQKVAKSSNANPNYTKPGPIFAIKEPFIVNLVGQNGRRYLKTSVALELSSAEFQKEVTTKVPIIKDRINYVLSSKSFEEVSTPKGKEKLKDQIIEELNTFMVDGYIKSVFFTDFVIQ